MDQSKVQRSLFSSEVHKANALIIPQQKSKTGQAQVEEERRERKQGQKGKMFAKKKAALPSEEGTLAPLATASPGPFLDLSPHLPCDVRC